MRTGRGSPVRQPATRDETRRCIGSPCGSVAVPPNVMRSDPRVTPREHVSSEQMPRTEPATDQTALLAALRCGDEDAFSALVDAYGAAMHRVALTFVRSSAVADEVVQEAWLGALRGLDRFEGRSSVKTWLLRIVANIARTHAVREARAVPFSSIELEREAAE